MAQEEDEEDITFNVEEVQKIIRDNIELCLGGNVYSHSRSPQWITVITEKTLARLTKLNKPFKYINSQRTCIATCSSCRPCMTVFNSAVSDVKHEYITCENDSDSEERVRTAYSSCIFLGYGNRRDMYRPLGKQIHVLYCELMGFGVAVVIIKLAILLVSSVKFLNKTKY